MGQMLAYRTFRSRPQGPVDPGRYGSLEPALETMRERLVANDGPFRVKRKGEEEWSRWVGLPRAMTLIRRIATGATGASDDAWVETSNGRMFVLDVGVIHFDVPPAPAGISAAIRQFHAWLFAECERLEVELGRPLRIVTKGYTVCKWINGVIGGTGSQHSPGPPAPIGGNALDWIIIGALGEVDIEATDILVGRAEQQPFVAQTLWRGIPNHFPYHVHDSGYPMRVGVPECLR